MKAFAFSGKDQMFSSRGVEQGAELLGALLRLSPVIQDKGGIVAFQIRTYISIFPKPLTTKFQNCQLIFNEFKFFIC